MTIYFTSYDSDKCHELTDDHPARQKDGKLCNLKDVCEGADVAVFLGSGWVEGWVRPAPTNYKFVVECVSFESELDVARALQKALGGFYNAPNSPIPWMKIVPPSKL